MQEWDKCGGSSVAPITITVGSNSGGGGVFTNLHQQDGWTGYALLPSLYEICSTCSPGGPDTTWAMTQKISSPSVSGNSAKMDIGGKTVYSDVLWNNHLIGDFSSQGLPDYDHKIVPNLHNFIYDVYFYVADIKKSRRPWSSISTSSSAATPTSGDTNAASPAATSGTSGTIPA